MYDKENRRYLDASTGSSGVSNFGHGISEIGTIIKEQVSKISVLPTHAFNSAVVEEYFARLVDFAPEGFARAWTVTSGTEAVENALKLALQYHQLRGEPGRYKIISRWNTYHGNSIFTLDIGGMKLRRAAYSEWLHNFPHVSPAYSYRMPEGMDADDYLEHLVEEFETTILSNDPTSIAAFIAEPVVAAALGAVPPPPGYFVRIAAVCKKYGILFIVDEVLTGFGRLGTPFGIQKFDARPDIIAAGKGISGGYYPLSAVLASAEVMEPFVRKEIPFLGGHTFACNPVGAAVGNYILDFIRDHHVLENCVDKGNYLRRRLDQLCSLDIVGEVRGEGLMLGIELVMDKITKKPFPEEQRVSRRIGERSIEKGVVLYPGRGSFDGIAGDHIMIVPPLIINMDHADEIVDVLKESIEEVMMEIE